MQSFTRRTALVGGTALAGATLAACSSDHDSSTDVDAAIKSPDDNVISDTDDPKIVKEKTTLTFMTGRGPTTAEDWNKVACMELAEKTTNLHIDFGLVPADNIDEKVNLALASGEYPEVFYRSSISSGDIAKYGDQGVFIALDDLISEYMPNFSKILDGSDAVRDGITMPDGHIYSLPQLVAKESDGMLVPNKLWVRKDWLDGFGMDVPTTLDEYEAYLEGCVSSDPLGDGKKRSLGFTNAGVEGLIAALSGTFSIRNKGTGIGNLDEDPEEQGKVRLWPMSDGYREMLTYLHKLYSRGLIMKDIFSTDEQKVRALGGDGVVGSAWNQTPTGYFGSGEGDHYVPVLPLKSDDNDNPGWHAVRSEVVGLAPLIMTDACTHPVEVARWADWWYGEEGARAFFMGIEGKSYQKKGEGWELKPEILAGGKQIGEAIRPYALYGGGNYPTIATDEWMKGVETTEQAMDAVESLKPYNIDDIWPKFTFTVEESEVLSAQGEDITKHIEESQAAFITGKKDLSEWDDYISKFKEMGLEEYLRVHQAAHDRRTN
jgi:putative aldouronate transport system substrate-binding protein